MDAMSRFMYLVSARLLAEKSMADDDRESFWDIVEENEIRHYLHGSGWSVVEVDRCLEIWSNTDFQEIA